ncbi:hypothetical protein [Hyphomicrobium sp. DY-1]|uniref:hypothetical protein n=1 Tax=Hyphomicrobium sp. DY-1 TaxID=3075650 RepID=UPI0039C47212
MLQPASKKHMDAIGLYGQLMEEVKVRIAAIQHISEGKTGLPGPIAQEIFYLQLRLIIELIALGALVAHGDIAEASRLKKEWKANEILERLEELHPSFFPQPAKQLTIGGKAHIERVDGGMSKEEMIKLYCRSGDYLHKGNLKKLLKAKQPSQILFPILMRHVTGIIKLLNFHVISLVGDEQMIACGMQTVEKNNCVSVSIFQKLTNPNVIAAAERASDPNLLVYPNE